MAIIAYLTFLFCISSLSNHYTSNNFLEKIKPKLVIKRFLFFNRFLFVLLQKIEKG